MGPNPAPRVVWEAHQFGARRSGYSVRNVARRGLHCMPTQVDDGPLVATSVVAEQVRSAFKTF